MTAHTAALKAVKENTFGNFAEMEEISIKIPWGFYREGCQNTHVDDFIQRPYVFKKTIALHILLGEGGSVDQMMSVLSKSLRECVRILMLEHNPDHRDWKKHKHVSHEKLKSIESFLNKKKLTYKKITIGNGRNVLYVISTIPHLHWNHINKKYIDWSAEFHRAGMPGAKKEVFAHTSEDFRRPDKLLDDEIVDFIVPLNLPLYSVVGGLMILDALLQIDPPKLYLTDCSFKQALYGCIVVNQIIEHETLEEFDIFLKTGITEESLTNKINALWNTDVLNQYLHSDSYWGKGNHWRHILKVGKWREEYGRVREILLSKLQSVEAASLRDVEIKEKQVVFYTSTVSEKHLPINESHVIISAEHKEFRPSCQELFDGKFSPIGVSKKGRDTNRIVIRDIVSCFPLLGEHLSQQISKGLS
jgi:hypothetical protein